MSKKSVHSLCVFLFSHFFYNTHMRNTFAVCCFCLLLSGCSGANSVKSTVAEPQKKTFYKYSCTQDCRGHERGYEWAEAKGIDDVLRCGGHSESFINGCKAYVYDAY